MIQKLTTIGNGLGLVIDRPILDLLEKGEPAKALRHPAMPVAD